MSTTDPKPHVPASSEAATPVVPEQRQHYDGSLTQQRVDAIFRGLVVQRAMERRAEHRARRRAEAGEDTPEA